MSGLPRAEQPGPKPPWLKIRLDTGENYRDLHRVVQGLKLHTVCQ